MEAMTSEREAFETSVRQWPNYSERTLARDGRYPEYYGSPVVQGAWEGWKARAHLVQPAQTVDVGAIREVAGRLMDGNPYGMSRGVCRSLADRLTRALSGEKAGPVGDGFSVVPDEMIRLTVRALRDVDTEMSATGRATMRFSQLASDLRGMLPASPTPDKEGQP